MEELDASFLSWARLSVLVNRNPTYEFSMQRGLRQGHPLSPFLLIIFMEALNVMMLEALEKGVFHGFKISNDQVKILISSLLMTTCLSVIGLQTMLEICFSYCVVFLMP